MAQALEEATSEDEEFAMKYLSDDRLHRCVCRLARMSRYVTGSQPSKKIVEATTTAPRDLTNV